MLYLYDGTLPKEIFLYLNIQLANTWNQKQEFEQHVKILFQVKFEW